MKYTIALLSAAVAVSAAQPHQHAHQHHHHEVKRDNDMVVVPGPTVIAYVLNGQPITEADVQEGIRNGTLVWAQGGGLQSVASSSTPATSSFAAPSSSSSAWTSPSSISVAAYSSPSSAPSSSAAASSSSYSAPASSSSSSYAASSSASSSSSATSSSSSSSSSSSGTGVDTDFPDGELDCSTFPSDYGAISVDWMGLGGWIGVQKPGSSVGGFSDIETVTSGGSCTDGSYCSYACPAGYQKSQWPSTQGATGQSVGGILCEGGKLKLTNSAMSSKLCMTGTDKVTVLVENKMSKNVAVCRTDYPGTESETVPLNVEPGATDPLTCPDADNYYNWEGSHTSAQYYVNPAGVSEAEACQWGDSSNPWGNFAPLNMGIGYSAGAAWLALFQNLPTTSAKLDFTVEITGDNLSGTCKYQNGQYCSGDDYSTCSSVTGCTVSISSGTATIVFSD